jgi:hypothetical protein
VCQYRAILPFVLLVFLAGTGCGKTAAEKSSSQPSSTSERAAAASATPQAAAVPRQQAITQGVTTSELTGEVTRGHGFEKAVAGGLIFRLEPDAGDDSGWEIRLAPGTEPSPASIDCIGAVSEPLHGDNTLSIQPPGVDKDRDESQWKKRDFDFVPNSSDCKRAWDFANEAHYPSNLTDKQREEADTKLGEIHTSHGVFQITDFRLSKPTSKDAPAQTEWLKFVVRLEFPSATQALVTSENSQISHKSIHDVDVEEFVTTHYIELDPHLESLKEECGEGQDPIRSVEVQYGDVDSDGQEEALFQGYTCMAGTSGVDYSGIVKLQPGGKLVGMPIAPAPDTFKGRKPFEGLRGHVRLEIENGRFVETYPVYKGDECEACSSGGLRKFVFRWNGHEFVLDDIINVPPDQAGN